VDAVKQRHIAFWKRLQALRNGELPIEDEWKKRSYDYVLPSAKEGLVVFHPEPQPPRIPYPEPVKVGERLDLRKAHIRRLYKILQKKMEFTHTIVLALNKVRDPQMKELLYANHDRQIREMDEIWRSIKMEIIALTGQLAVYGRG